MAKRLDGKRDVIVFDGSCGFCGAGMQWIAARDAQRKFVFLPNVRAAEWGLELDSEAIHVVLTDGRILSRTQAVFHVLQVIGWAPALVKLMRFAFNGTLGAIAYRWVARNRHRLVSQKTCSLESSYRDRFL